MHDTYETLYNSSEYEEVTNGIFHFKWKKVLKLVPKSHTIFGINIYKFQASQAVWMLSNLT